MLLLVGCADLEQGYTPAPALDEEMFRVDVEPTLEAQCANPSCHGRPERPLALYAPHRFRADPTRLFLDEPITEDELRHNYERSCAFAADLSSAEESLLWRKPLGLTYHGGGVTLSEHDPEARRIQTWLWSAFSE